VSKARISAGARVLKRENRVKRDKNQADDDERLIFLDNGIPSTPKVGFRGSANE
jgi:hypothetical protein